MKAIYLSILSVALTAPIKLGEPIGNAQIQNTMAKWLQGHDKARRFAGLAALGLGIAGLGVAVDQKNRVIEATKERERLAREMKTLPPFPVKNGTEPVSAVPQVAQHNTEGSIHPAGILGQDQQSNARASVAVAVQSPFPSEPMSHVPDSTQPAASVTSPLFNIGL